MCLYKKGIFWLVFFTCVAWANSLGILAWWSEMFNKRTQYILVWPDDKWFPFSEIKGGQDEFIKLKCPATNCFVTSNSTYFKDIRKFDAIAFNGKALTKYNLPKNRSEHQKYIFFNMESSPNYPVENAVFDRFFNLTATFRLDSDIRLPYMQIKDKYDNIVGPRRDMNWVAEEEFDREVVSDSIMKHKVRAAAIFYSNCQSLSDRKERIEDLRRELRHFGLTVDVYGSCGLFKCHRSNPAKCKERLTREYYFYLSYENSMDDDYVTEKLLTPLQHNVVPIVYGGANYSRFLPPGSYLDASEITAKKLAQTMADLILSPKKYMQCFWWKKYYTYGDPILKDNICNICSIMNDKNVMRQNKSYIKFRKWWNINGYDDDIADRKIHK